MIEAADDANEQRVKFKRAEKLQARKRASHPAATAAVRVIFLSSIFLSDHCSSIHHEKTPVPISSTTFEPSRFDTALVAQGAIEALVGAHAHFVDWAAADWSGGSRTANFNNGSETGTCTFTVVYRTGTGEAKLLGTSCPECGVMKPWTAALAA